MDETFKMICSDMKTRENTWYTSLNNDKNVACEAKRKQKPQSEHKIQKLKIHIFVQKWYRMIDIGDFATLY